jgi:3alpha(or 20beta)-hydroxysteroid dehydrogenase
MQLGSRLTGRVALVTGSTGGIGTEIVRRLAAEGARVAVTDLDPAPCAELVGELPGEHLVLALDVGDEEHGGRRSSGCAPGSAGSTSW